MHTKSTNNHGFGHLALLVIVLVIAVVGVAGWRVWDSKKHSDTAAHNVPSQEHTTTSDDQIVMKSIGFNLDYYNEATNKAGDMEFTKEPLMFDQIWGDFGQQDPRSPNDPTKKNPQPTYILPLGTNVRSLIDGVVTKVETLYSGDVTIWVSPKKDSPLSFETEHVSKPTVKVGDAVKSGQVIAEVSEHDSQNHPGFGILEIGVLGQNGNAPAHYCPYQYLDASVKEDTLKKITALHAAWEKYLGKDIYGDTYAIPGCVITDSVSG